MEGLCFKTRVQSMSSPAIYALAPVCGCPTDLRRNLPNPNAVARPPVAGTSISVEKLPDNQNLRPLPRNSSWTVGDFGDIDEDAPLIERGDENWILKILHVKSRCGPRVSNREDHKDESDIDLWRTCSEDDRKEEGVELDGNSFRRLLRRVSLNEAKVYAQMAYLGNLAYHILDIKPADLLRRYGLRYVTSSFEKKEVERKPAKDTASSLTEKQAKTEADNIRSRITATTAFQMVASAASYTRSILPFISPPRGKPIHSHGGSSAAVCGCAAGTMDSGVASLMATTDSVTAVVSAEEEVKQAVADDLNSSRSSPCEWFVCDDDQSHTRLFVIQGSESLASWQANLLFEPTGFEGLDVPVHRGIYEAAKGIYRKMLPEVRAHLRSHGDRAALRFTGHSLGGSLALLINLMLLLRGEVPAALLLPVITFGSPSVMFGGDRLLADLGLPLRHVQAVVMHRDIVPRAFSCSYPDHVAALLKAVNKNFRTHPCLADHRGQKLLYPPVGELLILQPDVEFSPPHHLLPPGRGLYLLGCGAEGRRLEAARAMFLDSPHPLDTLRVRGSYGPDGTIQRDHDMKSYVKTMRGVVWELLSRRRRGEGLWRPSADVGRTISGGTKAMGSSRRGRKASVMARASLNWFTGLVTSHTIQLLLVMSFPARVLIAGKLGGFRSG